MQAFSARTFLQTVIYHEGSEEKGQRWFMVASVPTEKEAEGVRGVYSCVELVQELENGEIEVVSLLTVSQIIPEIRRIRIRWGIRRVNGANGQTE